MTTRPSIASSSRRRSRPSSRRFGGVLALLMAVGVLMAATADAATTQIDSESAAPVPGVPTVVGVDATGPDVEVSILTDDIIGSSTEVGVVEDGEAVSNPNIASAVELKRPVEIIYVLDLDLRMGADRLLKLAAAQIAESAASLPSSTSVGLVGAGETAVLETRLGATRQQLREDLQALQLGRGAALYDAIAIAGRSFGDVVDGAQRPVRSVVVVSAGPDVGSTRLAAGAEAAVVQSGAQLISLSLGSADADLTALVAQTGGAAFGRPVGGQTSTGDQVIGADVDAELSALVAEQLDLATGLAADRMLVSYPATVSSGTRADVSITVVGSELAFSYPAGLATSAPAQLAARQVTEPIEVGWFGQPLALYLSVALAFVAIACGLWAAGTIFAGGDTTLDQRLATYSREGASQDLDDEELKDLLVHNALMQRAVDMTENFAAQQGFLARMEDLLERANLPVRAGEAVFFLTGVVFVSVLAVTAVTGNLLFGAVAGILAAVTGVVVVRILAARRLTKFEAQLPDALQLLAGTLRAGYSLPQGLDAVADEITDPMAQELRRAMTETQLGRELDDSLAAVAERLGSEDFAWVVMAIGIQREVGGNLAEVLLTVSDTMVQRERLHREVKALTAEGRVSAAILSLLPPGLGVVMWVMNPEYIEVLFSRTLGLIMLGGAVVAATVGLAWMKKVITIDV